MTQPELFFTSDHQLVGNAGVSGQTTPFILALQSTICVKGIWGCPTYDTFVCRYLLHIFHNLYLCKNKYMDVHLAFCACWYPKMHGLWDPNVHSSYDSAWMTCSWRAWNTTSLQRAAESGKAHRGMTDHPCCSAGPSLWLVTRKNSTTGRVQKDLVAVDPRLNLIFYSIGYIYIYIYTSMVKAL